MVTYPSTHGVFEEAIARDLRARARRTAARCTSTAPTSTRWSAWRSPARFGADVSHLNLHKTFCIPHGGGGPGVGPVAVRAHLAPYLPNHPLVAEAGPQTGVGPCRAAPWGSAGILPISWAYIRMMGGDGLHRGHRGRRSCRRTTSRTGSTPHYPVLYTGAGGLVAHECILDLRPLTKDTGVTVEDVAKRLIDYGFHAPTMSFPVAGTLMIEPTGVEDLAELDRFCEAMIAIRGEIDAGRRGRLAAGRQPAAQAPHTAEHARRGVGAPLQPRGGGLSRWPRCARGKYWPPVRRIDGAYGDRNLVCSCPPPEAFAA